MTKQAKKAPQPALDWRAELRRINDLSDGWLDARYRLGLRMRGHPEEEAFKELLGYYDAQRELEALKASVAHHLQYANHLLVEVIPRRSEVLTEAAKRLGL